jgi:hypothetical protein
MVEKKMLRGAMLVVALTGMVMTTPTSVQADPDGKVTICHIPPGNPENAHEITVSVSAVPAHLAHGDRLFTCSGEGEGEGEGE